MAFEQHFFTPVKKLLNEYLVNLQSLELSVYSFGSYRKFASKKGDSLQDFLKACVNLRNQLVHGVTQKVTVDTIEFLLIVKDILWLCEFEKGNFWALDYVRTKAREAYKSQKEEL